MDGRGNLIESMTILGQSQSCTEESGRQVVLDGLFGAILESVELKVMSEPLTLVAGRGDHQASSHSQ